MKLISYGDETVSSLGGVPSKLSSKSSSAVDLVGTPLLLLAIMDLGRRVAFPFLPLNLFSSFH